MCGNALKTAACKSNDTVRFSGRDNKDELKYSQKQREKRTGKNKLCGNTEAHIQAE